MGIQSNLVNMNLNVIKAIKSFAVIAEGEEGEAVSTAADVDQKQPKTSSQQGYIFLPEKTQRNSYNKALKSANNYIVEKNLSKSFDIDERIKMAQEATQFSAIDKGGNE